MYKNSCQLLEINWGKMSNLFELFAGEQFFGKFLQSTIFFGICQCTKCTIFFPKLCALLPIALLGWVWYNKYRNRATHTKKNLKKSFKRVLTSYLRYGIINIETNKKIRKGWCRIMNKMTKREGYTRLLQLKEVIASQELTDFVNHELDLLNRKNGSAKKPTANQLENEGLKDKILETLKDVGRSTITELSKDGRVSQYSNQKLSAIIRLLILDGKVTRTEEKKVAYFEVV